MLDDKTRDRIVQERQNCLGAKYLHTWALRKLSWQILLVDALALIVPILYFPVRYIGKGTAHSSLIEAIWEGLAALLLAVTVFKLVARWQDRFKDHGSLLGENIALDKQAVDLLSEDSATSESVKIFFALAEKVTRSDSEILTTTAQKTKNAAYREALKELGGPPVVCPICNSSPWKFKPGSCGACGNTPAA